VELLETHCATVYSASKEKQLSFNIFTPANLNTKIIGDPLRLLQVLNNLASNAIKFTDKGAINLFVELSEQALTFRYCDSGIGLTEDQMSTIFEDFNQADNSISRRFGGTGLGLNICKNLLELMQGSLAVSSVINQGSEFIATLPMTQSSNSNEEYVALKIQKTLKVVSKIDPEINEDLLKLGFNFDNDNLDYLFYLQDELENNDVTLQKLNKLQNYYSCPIIAVVDCQLIELCKDDFIALEKPYRSYQAVNAALQIKPLQKETKDIENSPNVLKDKAILLVEDVDINQLVVSTILEEYGAIVTIADNGHYCIDDIRNNPYDLILMDIQMPIMDGITATEIIRREHLADDTPIIALTANVFKEDIERYLDTGMLAHIPKPFDQDVMMATITHALTLK
jgi:CheY-like chemotaxis protein